MSAALRGEGITYAYGADAPVLRGVGVSLSAGTVTGIVGPNGSGKSTLMRLLTGHLPLQEGKVWLGEVPLWQVPPKQRGRAVAYMPQMVQPVFELTVRDVVLLGRYPHAGLWGAAHSGKDAEAVDRCLLLTHCTALQDRIFDTLSGGERQRALLASILAQEPEILLLDEPTAALDLHHQEEVFGLLRKLATDSGYAIGIITHDLNLAGRYCDELLLLGCDHGVTAYGAPAEVLQSAPLGEAYGADIQVGTNPFTGTPLVHAKLGEGRP